MIKDGSKRYFTGYVKKLFRNCPKPDGWFGCFFKVNGSAVDVRVTGHYADIDEGMELVIAAEYDAVTGEYKAFGIERDMRGVSKLVAHLSNINVQGSGSSAKILSKADARKAVAHFGSDTLPVMYYCPERFSECGIADSKIKALVQNSQPMTENAKFLRMFPFLGDTLIESIVKACKGHGYDAACTNPYDLLKKVPSLKFKTADKMALTLGFERCDSRRLKACLVQAFTRVCSDKGHMYLDISDNEVYSELLGRFYDTVGDTTADVKFLMSELNRIINNDDDAFRVFEYHGRYHVYDTVSYNSERKLGLIIRRLLHEKAYCNATHDEIDKYIRKYERKNGIRFDVEQIAGIHMALTHRFSVLTGGPGCGKTSTIDCVAYCWSKFMDADMIELSAPTGRAVSRLKESVMSVNVVPQTVARHITSARMAPDFDDFKKKYKLKLFIIDESSLLGLKDASDMLSLLVSSQVLIVGDAAQLPSVERGQFLADLCANPDVPKISLVVNHRSNGRSIIDNAKRITDGHMSPDFDYDSHFGILDFNLNDYSDYLVQTYCQFISNEMGMVMRNRIPDVCILSPVNKGPMGVHTLNLKLRELINPSVHYSDGNCAGFDITSAHYYPNDASSVMRVGDRVMYLKNHADLGGKILFDDGSKEPVFGVYNGDCGFIIRYDTYLKDVTQADGSIKKCETAYVTISFDDGRLFDIDEDCFGEITLAYALSVHKAQGCEFDTVLMSMPDNIRYMPAFATRNLLYTAVTRAKNSVRILGRASTIDACIMNMQPSRNSHLNNYISNIA